MLKYTQRRALVFAYYDWLDLVQSDNVTLDTESLETFVAFLVSNKLLDETKTLELLNTNNPTDKE